MIIPRPLYPESQKLLPQDLAAGRYGTYEMAQIWGAENTFALSIKVQALACEALSALHPDIIPPEHAEAIIAASQLPVDADAIRKLEQQTGHDVLAISRYLESKLPAEIAAHIGKLRTSADTTETVRALQLQKSIKVIAESLINLRDIVLEKAKQWIDVPHMDTTHLFDAMPTVLGRPFAHYGEMLQTNIHWLENVDLDSLMMKWGDATGNHHSAVDMGVDGLVLERILGEQLKLFSMTAPAQTPALEFQADVYYVMARIGETLNNLAKFIALGKGDDLDIFRGTTRKKGSSAMPHKDAKGGNPTTEEQIMSLRNYLVGNLVTGMMNCEMPYARNLAASANSRINLEDGFKFLDHGIRSLAKTVFELKCNEQRCQERIDRSFGIIASARIVNYLTDQRRYVQPMSHGAAHDLVGQLATRSFQERRPFLGVLAACSEIMIPMEILKQLCDVTSYVGESKRIIEEVVKAHYQCETIWDSDQELDRRIALAKDEE